MVLGTALTSTGGRPLNTIFNFLSNTDVLVLQDSDVLNRESIDEYQFTVVAEDTEGLISSATITVVITDVNDEIPFIENAGSVGNTGLLIAEYIASFPDSTPPPPQPHSQFPVP